MVCKSSAVIINTRVDALIALNEMQINDVAIELLNNGSVVYENIIQKSHLNGIQVKCDNDNNPCCPIIQKNYIEASTHNGIVCEGYNC